MFAIISSNWTLRNYCFRGLGRDQFIVNNISKMQIPNAKNQYFAQLVVNILAIVYGVLLGWASPTINLLKSDETPLKSGKITMEDASWIASLLAIGSLIGNVICGISMNKFGRKLTLILLAIPIIVSWVLVIFAQNVYYLFIARIIHGLIPGGFLLVGPVFMREIANDNIRGTLVSLLILNGNVGISTAYALGAFCSFNTTPIFSIALIVVFVVIFSFFPETPTFLVKQNKIAEAEKSIRFYKNIHEKRLVQLEIGKLKDVIGNGTTKQSNKNSLKWSDFTTKPGSSAIMIGVVVSVLVQFSGGLVLLSYVGHIFEESGSAFTPNISAIIIGVLQFCGTTSLIILVDFAGRRFLYIISTIGATLGYIFVGVYVTLGSKGYDVDALNFIPIVGLSFVIFILSLAVSSLAFTIITEIMPEKMKEFSVTFCNILMGVEAFICIKYFPLLTELIGLDGCMFLYAGICLLGAVFIIFKMPETKGRSYEEIMRLLS